MPHRIAAILLLAAAPALPAELKYQKPPQEILDVLNAPPPPAISVNPSRDYAIQMGAPNFASGGTATRISEASASRLIVYAVL